MPAMPTKTEALPNGVHTLIVIEVTHDKKGQYGLQEEAKCIVEGMDEDFYTRVWVSHTSVKQVQTAIDAGLANFHEETNSWDIQPGARFQAVAAGGKIVTLMKAPASQPVQGNSQ